MRRETLSAILQSAIGMKKEGDGFSANPEQALSLYLGEPGNAMVINGVRGLLLAEEYLVIDAGIKGKIYTSYEAVHALADRAADGGRVAGAGVGFE